MRIFDEQPYRLKVGEEAFDFSIDRDCPLSNFKGNPIFLVFWKGL